MSKPNTKPNSKSKENAVGRTVDTMLHGRRALTSAAAVAIAVLIVIAGCNLQSPAGTTESESVGSSPGDSINDVSRVYAASAELGGFDYDGMPAVQVKLAFVDSSNKAVEGAVATLQTANQARVYRGRSNSEGLIVTAVSLPSAPEDITLLVERPGFQSRRMVIEEMVRYEAIDRRLELRRAEGGMSAQGGDGMASALSSADSDGDGVPDKHDDFPHDPERAFHARVPAEGMITVAFEDLYPRYDPDDPHRFFDADFNDFVARYAIEEITNSEGKLVELKGKVHAIERLAGYNHLFGMLFRFEGHSADLHVNGPAGRGPTSVQDYADVVLFESTRQLFPRGHFAVELQTIPTSFTITFPDPVPRDEVTKAPYDPYIKVHNTGEYIHRIGMEPHPYAPPSDGDGWNYRHPSTGMPWALIIPQEDWIYPGEMVFIEDVYPAFRYWRESFGEHYPDWYTYYKEDPGEPEDPSDDLIVSYDGNQHDEGSPPDDAEYEEGDEVTVLGNSGNLRKAGHGFTGWNSAPDGSGDFYEVGDTFLMPADGKTLYAHWKDDYAIGEVGPAGGWIFYDRGVVEDGWRFLEAAPGDIAENGTETFDWSDVAGESVGGTSTEIGAGEANTDLIVNQEGHVTSAAKRTVEYATESLGGTFGDWFLPSLDELGEVYTGLHAEARGEFADARYWSSSEAANDTARDRHFGQDGDPGTVFKDTPLRVRAVRAF